MDRKAILQGHLLALAAVVMWGMTFIASKVMVGLLDPYWYIVIRFAAAWVFLFALSPKPLKLMGKREEGWFALCGLAGVTLYYIFQNVALVHSTASNTGVISALSSIFAALILFFGGKVKLTPRFFLGFVLCMGGVAAISFAGATEAGIHLLGDTFAVLAAAAWGLYCVIIVPAESHGLPSLHVTRKVFFWGTLLTVPFALLLGEPVPVETFTQGGLGFWGPLVYVSLCSSALCYLFWGKATGAIGAVTCSLYMYLLPVVSVIGSALLLGEPVTVVTLLAIAAILAGVVLSERGSRPAAP